MAAFGPLVLEEPRQELLACGVEQVPQQLNPQTSPQTVSRKASARKNSRSTEPCGSLVDGSTESLERSGARSRKQSKVLKVFLLFLRVTSSDETQAEKRCISAGVSLELHSARYSILQMKPKIAKDHEQMQILLILRCGVGGNVLVAWVAMGIRMLASLYTGGVRPVRTRIDAASTGELTTAVSSTTVRLITPSTFHPRRI
eukprot:1339290-Amphidinium_carterae.1